MKFHHTPAPVTRLPLRNRRDRPNCCACFDCSGSKGFSRSREKQEWRRGIIVPRTTGGGPARGADRLKR